LDQVKEKVVVKIEKSDLLSFLVMVC
jgi:hypothetical protein